MQLWNQLSKAQAERYLSVWAKQTQDSGLRVLQQFAKTPLGHRTGLLNWYDHPLSTGPLEAANNKLKLLQRRTIGDRDLDFFKLKILAMHKCRFALVG
jgi:transposase